MGLKQSKPAIRYSVQVESPGTQYDWRDYLAWSRPEEIGSTTDLALAIHWAYERRKRDGSTVTVRSAETGSLVFGVGRRRAGGAR